MGITEEHLTDDLPLPVLRTTQVQPPGYPNESLPVFPGSNRVNPTWLFRYQTVPPVEASPPVAIRHTGAHNINLERIFPLTPNP